jgi:hypothetical protein
MTYCCEDLTSDTPAVEEGRRVSAGGRAAYKYVIEDQGHNHVVLAGLSQLVGTSTGRPVQTVS